MGTHYESLGVPATADAAAIRAAYLAKARAHHPDRNIGAPPAAQARAARAMREANAAWAVLGDVRARREYDLTLAAEARRAAAARAATRPAAAPQQRPQPVPGPPVRAEDDELALHDRIGCSLRVIPTLAMLVLLLGIFVFTAFAATRGEKSPRTPFTSDELFAGDCVLATAVLDAVPCSQRHDAVVVSIASVARGCPPGTAVYTIDASRVACLRPTP